jgi:hypothetical protein
VIVLTDWTYCEDSQSWWRRVGHLLEVHSRQDPFIYPTAVLRLEMSWVYAHVQINGLSEYKFEVKEWRSNMIRFNNTDDVITQLAKEIYERRDQQILSQLNEHISRGLISVEETTPQLVRSFDSDKLEFKMGIKLVLKEQEYVESLEAENKKLKEQLQALLRIKKENE